MDIGNRANRGDNGTTDQRTDRGGGDEANEDMIVEDRGLGRRVGIPPHGGVGRHRASLATKRRGQTSIEQKRHIKNTCLPPNY